MDIKRITTAYRIMQCTPRELQRVLDVMHGWGLDITKNIETVQDIIDFLTCSEYIKEAEDFKYFTGEDYLKAMFNI